MQAATWVYEFGRTFTSSDTKLLVYPQARRTRTRSTIPSPTLNLRVRGSSPWRRTSSPPTGSPLGRCPATEQQRPSFAILLLVLQLPHLGLVGACTN